MIFISLGTQDKPFTRLLKLVDEAIDKGIIKEKVIVQAGYTKYQSKNMQIFDLLDKDMFDKYIKECDILITHGGVGSIITGLKNNKVVIASPRLYKYGEHMNDHQKEIIERFTESGFIIPLNENDELELALKKAKKFKPKSYTSNTENMINLIKNYIDKN